MQVVGYGLWDLWNRVDLFFNPAECLWACSVQITWLEEQLLSCFPSTFYIHCIWLVEKSLHRCGLWPPHYFVIINEGSRGASAVLLGALKPT